MVYKRDGDGGGGGDDDVSSDGDNDDDDDDDLIVSRCDFSWPGDCETGAAGDRHITSSPPGGKLQPPATDVETVFNI